MGWFSNSKCKWCSLEDKSKEKIALHEETCNSGNLENPITLVEFYSLDYREMAGIFDSYKDIHSKLKPLKDDGWIIHRKISTAYGVQWWASDYHENSDSSFETIYDGEVASEKKGLEFDEAVKLTIKWINELNPKYESEANKALNTLNEKTILKAKKHEKLLEFDAAAEIYKELMMDDDVVRVRKLKAEQGAVKVTQKVVHGDEISNTEIKDSVLNRSNIGTGGKSKSEELREAKALLDDGLIDDEEFKQMKKEILGK